MTYYDDLYHNELRINNLADLSVKSKNVALKIQRDFLNFIWDLSRDKTKPSIDEISETRKEIHKLVCRVEKSSIKALESRNSLGIKFDMSVKDIKIHLITITNNTEFYCESAICDILEIVKRAETEWKRFDSKYCGSAEALLKSKIIDSNNPLGNDFVNSLDYDGDRMETDRAEN